MTTGTICPFCGDNIRLVAKVVWDDGGALVRETVKLDAIQVHHYVEGLYCWRHRVMLEPLRGIDHGA